MKQLRQFGYELLNWSYTIEKGKVIKQHYKDIRSMYPSLYFNNYNL